MPASLVNGESGVSEVLANIARLETRARHMTAGSGATRVARNAKSVYDASCRVLASNQGASSAEINTGSDAFLTSIVGFDLHEQKRLVQQMSSKQAEFAQPIDEADVNGCVDGGVAASSIGVDLELFLARRRMEALDRAVRDVHFVFDQEQQLVGDAYATEAIDERTNEIADMLGVGSLRLLDIQRPQQQAESSTGRLAMAAEEKIRAFADVIEGAPAPAWPDLLTNVVIEHASGDLEDPLVVMWSTAQGALSYRIDNPSAPSPVQGVACSRAVLEDKYLMEIFALVLQADPSRFEELSRMHPTKMREYIDQYCSVKHRGESMWFQLYVAMRAGRYETAHLIALENGNQSLATAIKHVSSTPLIHRNAANANADVHALWNDEQTRNDAFRCAVLVVLAGSNLNATNEAAVQLLDTLCGRVADSLEDVLWLRLAVVRYVGDQSDASIHNLLELQRRVLEDKPHILAMVGADPVRYATVMFHCLLPSTAVRVLLDNPTTNVDGTHVALMYDAFDAIQITSAESSVNIDHLLRRHAQVLLSIPARDGRPNPGRAVFDYFSKTEHGRSFISFCNSPQVVARLFGRIDDRTGREGELLSAIPSLDLLDAMELVARDLVDGNNAILAVHVLIVLDRCASARKDLTRGATALLAALRAITPRLAHAIHSVHLHRDSKLLHVANCLHEDVAVSRHDLPHDDVDAFRTLRALLTAHVCVYQGDEETAFRAVSSIPFIPQSPALVSEFIRRHAEFLRSDDVQTTLDPSCRMLMSLYVSRFFRAQAPDARENLRQRGQALLLWAIRWESAPSADLIDFLTVEHEKMLC